MGKVSSKLIFAAEMLGGEYDPIEDVSNESRVQELWKSGVCSCHRRAVIRMKAVSSPS